MNETKTLAPPTADRSLKGRIDRKRDLHKRIMATAERHGDTETGRLFGEMADEVAGDIIELQMEGRK